MENKIENKIERLFEIEIDNNKHVCFVHFNDIWWKNLFQIYCDHCNLTLLHGKIKDYAKIKYIGLKWTIKYASN